MSCCKYIVLFVFKTLNLTLTKKYTCTVYLITNQLLKDTSLKSNKINSFGKKIREVILKESETDGDSEYV